MKIPSATRLAAVAATVVVAVVLGVVLTRGEDSVPAEMERRAAPAISLPDVLDPSARIELESLRGKPVVVNFWASWCVPCRKELPHFEAAHQRFGDRVAFLGVNHQDGRTPARDLLRQTGVTYPSGSDPDGKVASDYRLRGMPSTVFVSSGGQIVASHTGELNRSQLEEMVEKFLLPPR
ncbi:MAG TPA: TlpA disulfide reductase family protein [Acidimicrobiales bacterium]|nr:TlpA disulfide reductase family protein [Acidimicrobiales bacterium]